MKANILTTILLALGILVFGQSTTDSAYYSRLFYSCKVWGFVKYFHPKVADRTVDYDEILLALLPQLRTATSQQDFNQLLSQMITNTGEVPVPSTVREAVPADLRYNLDLNWFSDSCLSDQLKQQLNLIYDRFRPQQHCLVRDASGMPFFDAEKDITKKNFQIEYLRLLTLFRYWNIIQYFYPYTNLMDQDWDNTLKEFIPRLVGFSDLKNYYNVWGELVAHLNTAHAMLGSEEYYGLFPDAKPKFYTDFSVVRIGNNTVIDKVKPGTTDVNPGDIVRKVNGTDVQVLRDLIKPRVPAGNETAEAWQTDNISILRSDSTGIELELEDSNGLRTIKTNCNATAPYFTKQEQLQPLYRDTVIDGGEKVTIVNLAKLVPDSVPPMGTGFWNSDCIIFDIRNYPNGTLYKLMDGLYTGPVHFANFLYPSCTYPGTFIRQEMVYESQGTQPYQGQVILLVNERSMSHAEFTAMALKLFQGAVVIGKSTAGADGNVFFCDLLAYMRTYFEVLGITNPDGSQVQRVGIKIDIPVNLTIQGLREGKDEYLETAFKYISLSAGNVKITDQTTLSIYPNPVTDYLTVDSRDLLPGQKLNIYTTEGRFIREVTITQGMENINVSDLPIGIYLISLADAKDTSTIRFIKL